RQVSEARDAAGLAVEGELEQPGDSQRFAPPEVHGPVSASRIQARDRRPAGGDDGAGGEVDRTGAGIDGQADDGAVAERGDEAEPYAKLLEGHGDGRSGPARGRLGYGHGEFAAGEEIRLMSVERHQVGFGEDFEERIASQGAEQDLEIGPLEDPEDGGVWG